MKCEYCEKEHDGSYGSGRFCGKPCSKGFSTKSKRKEINEKVSKKLTKNIRACSVCGSRISRNNISGICRKCRPPAKIKSEVLIEHRRKRKRDLVEHKGGKCEVCGYDKSMWALQFHHLNPEEKDYNLSGGGFTRSLENDIKEVDKCILVCANCHAEIHEKQHSRLAQLVEQDAVKS